MTRLLLLGLLAALPLAACDSGSDAPAAPAGAAYVMSNEATNRVVAYARAADGALSRIGSYETGGAGSAGRIVPALDQVVVDPLFSNDALILSPDRSRLFVANPGSGTVTSFRVEADFSLTRVGIASSGGDFPNTLSYRDGLLYVGNVNDPANGLPSTVSGLRVGADGALTPIAGSTRTITSATGQVSHVLFSPDGRFLMVAELMANTISAFPVADDGTLGTPRASASAPGAFGLGFADVATLVSTDVGPPMTPNAGTATTYRLASDGTLALVGTVGNGQNATCWVAMTPDRRFAYASNTTSGTVSAYGLADGQLSLLNAVAAQAAPMGGVDFMGTPSSGPADTYVTPDGRFLYQQWTGRGTVSAYAIGTDGGLTLVGEYGMGDVPTVGAEGFDGF